MQLTMYNVDFGDCFLLREKNDAILVDFGSKSNEKDLEKVINAVKRTISSISGGKAAMLSHYHTDHYKFFYSWGNSVEKSIEENGIFDTFYLPYIYFDKGKRLCTLAEEAIYTYIFTKGASDRAKFFLVDSMKMLLNTVKRSGNIRLLSEGNYFSLGNIRCEVLWLRKCNIINANLNGFQSYLFTALKDFSKKKIVSSINTKSGVKNITKLYTVNDIWHIFRKIEANICKYFDILSGDGSESIRQWDEETRNAVAELAKQQDELLHILNDVTFDIKWDNTKHKHDNVKGKLRNLYRKDNNATSVVFRVPCKGSKRNRCYQLLMTGDITKWILKVYLKQYFDGVYYNCIKCPHHGTSKYYADYLRQCNWLLISTNNFGNYGKISEKYEFEKIGKNVCDTIKFVRKLCTNGGNWCELCEEHRLCRQEEVNIEPYAENTKRNHCLSYLDYSVIYSQCNIPTAITLNFLEAHCCNSS